MLTFMQRRYGDIWFSVRKLYSKFFAYINEQMASTEDIAACGAKGFVLVKLKRILAQLLPDKVRAIVRTNNVEVVSSLLFTMANILALGISSYLFIQGTITLGSVYVIFKYTEMLRSPVERMDTQIQEFLKAKSCIMRICEIFEIPKETDEGSLRIEEGRLLPVEFSGVSFSYNGNDLILKNISFRLEGGCKLGIIGRTGCGKSTLVQLLMRYYPAAQGEILVDGVNINEYSLKEYRKNISFITQDISIIGGTFRENLRLFDPGISDAEIYQTIEWLNLMPWFSKFENGLDTEINSKAEISEGEAQLISIVRALIQKSRIIVMDEATSKIDPFTEQLLHQAFEKIMAGRTCIIIAHHLQTLESVDYILYLEQGSIATYGLREKLVQNTESKFYSLLEQAKLEQSNLEDWT
jgi:ATP-binding cassette subfamily B protein